MFLNDERTSNTSCTPLWRIGVALLFLILIRNPARSQCPTDLFEEITTICADGELELNPGELFPSSPAVTWTSLSMGGNTIDFNLVAGENAIVSAGDLTDGIWTLQFLSNNITCDAQLEIEILELPDAGFVYTPDAGPVCSDVVLDFQSNEPPGLGFLWTVNGEEVSTQSNPLLDLGLTGTGTQNANVELTVTGANGCVASSVQSIPYLPLPTFDVAHAPMLCTGMPNFPNVVFTITTDNSASLHVNLGNGDVYDQTGGGSFTANYFDEFGYVPVLVEAMGTNGCEQHYHDSVFVGTNPQVGTQNPGNTDGFCSTDTIWYPIQGIENNPPGTTYTVSFGDGESIVFTHDDPLTVPSVVGHSYFFGSCGNTTPEGSPNAFRFKIEASNLCANAVVTLDPIRVHQSPQPDLFGPLHVCQTTPATYYLDSIGYQTTPWECYPSTIDWEVGASTGILWDIDSLTMGLQFQVSNFPEIGPYDLNYVVEGYCDTVEVTEEICVYPPLEPVGTALPTEGCAPLVVNLENLTLNPVTCGVPIADWSVAGGGNWEWLSGEAHSDLGQIQFNQAGTYTITLTLDLPQPHNSTTCYTAAQSFEIEVRQPPNFMLNDDGPSCLGDSIGINVTGLNQGNAGVDNWVWEVDNQLVTTGSTSYTLPAGTAAGTYTVSATATNICGSTERLRTVEVLPLPDVGLAIDDSEGSCLGDTLTVVASGPGIMNWQLDWDVQAVDSAWSNEGGSMISVHAAAGDIPVAIHVADAFGCENDSAVVVHFAEPVEVALSLASPGCPGVEVQIQSDLLAGEDTSPTYAWWLGDSLIVDAQSSNWAFLAPDTATPYTVIVEINDAFGCAASDTLIDTTLTALPIEAGLDTVLCLNADSAVSLTGFSPGLLDGGLGEWSGPNITSNGIFTPALSGDNWLYYAFVDTLGCVGVDSLVVEVVAPVTLEPGTPPEACINDPAFAIAGFSPASAAWSGPTGVSTEGIVTPADFSPGAHDLIFSDGVGSCYQEVEVTLTIHPLPVPELSGTDEICEGEVFTVEGTEPGGADLFWAGESTASATFSGIASTTDPVIEVLAVSAAGCEAAANWTLNVQALPALNLGSLAPICDAGLPVLLDQATPAGGVWSGPGVVDDVFTPVGEGEVDLVYSYIDPTTQCANSDNLTIAVQPLVQANAGPDHVICDVDTTLTFLGAPDASGTWSGEFVSGNVVDANSHPPGSFEYVYTHGAGTCETTDTLILVVLELPEVELVTTELAPCIGDTVEATAIVSNGTPGPHEFNWWGSVNELNSLANSSFAFVIATAGGSLPITVEVNDIQGCSRLETDTLQVPDLPIVQAGVDLTLCDQPITEVLEGFSPAGGTWSGIGVNAGGVFDPDLAGEGGPYILTYTYTEDDTGCTATDSISVIVEAPQLADAGSDLSFCAGDISGVLAGFSPDSGGTWLGAALGTDGNYDISSLVPGDYVWTYSYGSGTCQTEDALNVTIFETPSASLSVSDAVCDGETIVFDCSTGGGTGDLVIDWSSNLTPTAGTSAEVVADYSSGSTVSGSVVVTDDEGCLATDDVEVVVHALPVVDAGLDTTLCATGIEAVLSAEVAVPGLGMWSGGAIDAGGVVSTNITGVFEAIFEFTETATGCVNRDTVQVEIVDAVLVEAGPDTVACFNAPPVTFAGVTPGTGVSWATVDPLTQVEVDGTVAPADLGPGVHLFEAMYGVATCLTRDTVAIEVLPLPVIDMPSPEAFCGNLGVQVLSGAGPVGGVWFGLGVVDGSAGTFNTEMAPAMYTPGYHYTDVLTGCRDTAYHTVNVHPVPVAAFDSPDLGCTNAPVDLVQESTGNSGQIWSFPPFATSPASTPVFSYPAAGNYTINLLVNNNFGCEDSATAGVTITIPPSSAFDVSTDFGCTPLAVSFTDLSTAPFADTTWTINGVVQPATSLPDTTFSASGNLMAYEVELTVENLCGVSASTQTIEVFPAPEAAFAVPEDTVCSPYDLTVLDTSPGLPDAWAWTFSSGVTSSAESPAPVTLTADSIPSIYDVSLAVSNACGFSDTSLQVVVLPNAVTAFFTTNSSGGCAPFTLEVTDVSDETVYVSYDFGNGDFSDDTPTAFTTYTQAGIYSVQQFVSDGCSADTTETTIVVSESPEITFTTSPADCANAPVNLQADVSTAVGAANWDFGDGTSGGGLTANHNYPAGGTYWAVFETASALNGCPATDSVLITVHPMPTVNFSVDEPIGCSPFEVGFDNASSGTGLQFAWDFGDGTDGTTAANPTHTYVNNFGVPVVVPVSLTATNIYTCTATATGSLSVLPEPVAALALAAAESCSYPANVQVANLSTGSFSHEWLWSGGEIINAFEPAGLTADGVGTFTLTLTATNIYGCSDVTSADFTVHEAPVADFSVHPAAGCSPLSLVFTNLSTNTTSATLNIPGIYQGDLPASLLIEPIGSYTASLQVVSPEGCTDAVTLPGGMQVFPVPDAGFTMTPFADEPENTAYTFESTSSTDFQLNWSLGDGTVATGEEVFHEFDGSGMFQVELMAINEYGCPATHSEWVDVSATLMVFAPTAFTPGGQGDFGIARPDGLNDGWRPEIRGMQHVDAYWLQVFNRWGEVVWETRDPDAFWTGSDTGGKSEGDHYVQDEVYVWQLRLSTSGDVLLETDESGVALFNGIVTILR